MRGRLVLMGRVVRVPKPKRSSTGSTSSTSSVRQCRRFTANVGRPQLPFLSTPTAPRPHQFRYLTTERKAWIRHEVRVGIQYTLYIWVGLAAVAAIWFALEQERLERLTPTPHEWWWWTRFLMRGVYEARDHFGPAGPADWVRVATLAMKALKRLEDPDVDGKGVRDQDWDGNSDRDSDRNSDRDPDTSSSAVPSAKDVSDMPESWRRGYYEALMAYAKACEHVNGWVRDKTRDLVFPPDVVIGPSNPRPAPIPFGSPSPPREEDCEVSFPSPDDIYERIIHTRGLTSRQRLDAYLAYANWLEFRGHESAGRMYEEAVQMAASGTPGVVWLDASKGILDDKALPSGLSDNLLRALTARATFQARRDPSSALPMLVSLLRARRSLPNASKPVALPVPPPQHKAARGGPFTRAVALVQNFFAEPPYPAPPPDGWAPPARDAKELCEEAALQLYIGEILCAAQLAKADDGASPDEGLAWTREAVDVAEEQLQRLANWAVPVPTPAQAHGVRTALDAATSTCRACLSASLKSWHATTTLLAARETEAQEAAERARQARDAEGKTVLSSAWWALWTSSSGGASDGEHDQSMTRWAAENKVVSERMRRSQGLLEVLPPPRHGLMSLFRA